MIQPVDDRTPPMTPQLALRVAIVGTFALAMFALIFFRLWFLQVLSGSQYAAAAQGNNVQSVPVAAPRGEILASNGTVLADSQPVPAVVIAPQSLPVPITLATIEHRPVSLPANDYPVFDELAKLLPMSTKPRACTYYIYPGPVKYNPRLARIPCLIAKSEANSSFANATIKTNVSPDIQTYIAERQAQPNLKGVRTQDVYLRKYPQPGLAVETAQVLGYVGQITGLEYDASKAKTSNFKGANDTDVVGQTGLENEYNRELMGTDGSERVKVNSAGDFEGYDKEVQPTPGDNLKLSLDPSLERAGDNALKQSISVNSGAGAFGGAFVAIDPQNGQIYGMGSLPSYNPSIFANGISQTQLTQLESADANAPLVNRAIDGPLPDGSTFKVITATAALESGQWQLGDTFSDPTKFCMGTGPEALCLQNSGDAHYYGVDLQEAIEVSDDEFFYNLGERMYSNKGNGGALQTWGKNFGLGQTTGVDLPDEANGEFGSPKLQSALWKQELECQSATGAYAYTNAQGLVSATKRPGYHRSSKTPAVMTDHGNTVVSGGCAIANANYWTVGDNVETGVGQYDDQVTPLQLAVVYSAIENGGTIVTPHVGEDIESPSGTVLEKIDPAPKRKLDINPSYLAAIQQGLRLAASGSGGTSADVMGNFPEPVYGKTGTAELGDLSTSPEDAWYACYVPASATSKPIVVVVNVDKGGFGAVAAAPVAREILSQWFLGRPGPYTAGTSGDL